MAFDALDSFSSTVAQQLFARFPEWRAFARVTPYDDGTAFLLVEVPAPGQASTPLTISTSDEELTVSFGHFHSHCNNFEGPLEQTSPRSAASLVDDLLNERAVAVSWWNEDKWCGSTLRAPAAHYDMPESFESSTRVRIRSWLGTYNADHAV